MSTGAVPTELGTKPINALIRQYAVPGIIAMTASSLYNMVDSVYIGHIADVGSLSIAGLAVTFPLMNISTAFGTLVGVGAATMISVLLGQKNYKVAGKVLCNDISLNLITGIVFTAVMLLWMDPILRFFGASDATLPFARNYMTIIALGNAVTHLYFGLNAIIRSSGNPRLAMGLTLFTVTSNAILDPIFIFTLDMGIQGAALATVLCQCMALGYTLWYFMNPNRFLHLPRSLKMFRVDWKIAKDSLAIGMGPFLMNLASCIVVLFINQQLVKWGGDLAIGAYGIVNRITFLFIMVVMGLNQGMQPIAGYNFGARQYSRLREVYLKTAGWATLVMVIGFIFSVFLLRFPGPAHGAHLYLGPGAHPKGGARAAHHEHRLPHCGLPDGHHQPVPVPGHGEQVRFPFPVAAAALPAAVHLRTAGAPGIRERRLAQFPHLGHHIGHYHLPHGLEPPP